MDFGEGVLEDMVQDAAKHRLGNVANVGNIELVPNDIILASSFR